MQCIARQALDVDTDEHVLTVSYVSGDDGGMLRIVHEASESDDREVTMTGGQRSRGPTLDKSLILPAVADQVGNGNNQEPVLVRKRAALGCVHHGAVVIHHLAEGAGRMQSRKCREVHSCLGVAGTAQHTARHGAQRHNVSWSGEVAWSCLRITQRANRDGAIHGRDAGRCHGAGVDGDGVRRALAILVDDRHGRQVQVIEVLAGHADADVSARVTNHEGREFARCLLGREDEVPLVFPPLVVDDDDSAPIGDGLDGIVDGIHPHGIVIRHGSPCSRGALGEHGPA